MLDSTGRFRVLYGPEEPDGKLVFEQVVWASDLFAAIDAVLEKFSTSDERMVSYYAEPYDAERP